MLVLLATMPVETAAGWRNYKCNWSLCRHYLRCLQLVLELAAIRLSSVSAISTRNSIKQVWFKWLPLYCSGDPSKQTWSWVIILRPLHNLYLKGKDWVRSRNRPVTIFDKLQDERSSPRQIPMDSPAARLSCCLDSTRNGFHWVPPRESYFQKGIRFEFNVRDRLEFTSIHPSTHHPSTHPPGKWKAM